MIQKGTSQQIKNLMPKLLKLFFTKKKANGKKEANGQKLNLKSKNNNLDNPHDFLVR